MVDSGFKPVVVFHPGVTLAEKLKEMKMGIKEFALRTSKPEKTIHAVIKGKSSITSDMAVAFESVTSIPAHFWLNKQRKYDEWQARLQRESTMTPIATSREDCYFSDFHRSNSMAAQREVLLMSLRPVSREQKIKQIKMLKESGVSKENSTKQRKKP